MSKKDTHCQGCGELHRSEDFVVVCIHCLQNKFIPRLNWHEVGFMDRKSFEQWWSKTKKMNTKALIKQIEEQIKRNAVKRAFLGEPEFDIDDEEEILGSQYKKEFKDNILQ